MSIANDISSAIQLLTLEEFDSAVSLISNTIDATGKKEFPNDHSGKRSKKFLTQNQGLITKIGLNIELTGKIEYSTFGFTKDGNGYTLADILYEFVRCSLTHESSMSPKVIFDPKYKGVHTEPDKIFLPTKIIWGMLLAVIASPKNKNEQINSKKKVSVNFNNRAVNVNDLWGDEIKIRKLIDSN